MQRIPEPELMNMTEQARAYAEADFTTAHQSFIDHFNARFPQTDISGEVLDLGCGPCDITRRFALAHPAAILHAIDGAPAMLQEAARLNAQQGFTQRIMLIESMLDRLQLPQYYHTIISNSLLHHLHDPHVLWDCIKQYAKPSARVFVMDLFRPADKNTARQMVEQYAAGEPEVLQKDFYHSLCAAFTPQEVQQQLDQHSLSQLKVETTSDRHIIIYGTL